MGKKEPSEWLWSEIKKMNPNVINKACSSHIKLGLIYETDEEKSILHDFIFLNRYTFTLSKIQSKVKQPSDSDIQHALGFLDYIPVSQLQNKHNLKKYDVLITSPGVQEYVKNMDLSHYTFHNNQDQQLKERIIDDILEKDEIFYPLAHNFAGFRDAACHKIISLICTENAALASGTGLGNIKPGPHQIFTAPLEAISDFTVLTLNEIRMALILSGLCGNKSNFVGQLDDIGLIVGLGLTARSLATNIKGKVPVIGLPAKAAVAYSFTWAIGEALLLKQMTGKNISRKLIKDLSKKLLEDSKKKVQEFLTRRKEGKMGA